MPLKEKKYIFSSLSISPPHGYTIDVTGGPTAAKKKAMCWDRAMRRKEAGSPMAVKLLC